MTLVIYFSRSMHFSRTEEREILWKEEFFEESFFQISSIEELFLEYRLNLIRIKNEFFIRSIDFCYELNTKVCIFVYFLFQEGCSELGKNYLISK